MKGLHREGVRATAPKGNARSRICKRRDVVMVGSGGKSLAENSLGDQGQPGASGPGRPDVGLRGGLQELSPGAFERFLSARPRKKRLVALSGIFWRCAPAAAPRHSATRGFPFGRSLLTGRRVRHETRTPGGPENGHFAIRGSHLRSEAIRERRAGRSADTAKAGRQEGCPRRDELPQERRACGRTPDAGRTRAGLGIDPGSR